jgi:sugar phosphate isomerase/epimerase
MMNFACVTMVAPGATLTEQCAHIAAAGCAGVETIIFPDTPLETWQQEIRTATENAGVQLVAVILGGLALNRPGQLPWIGEALHAINGVGAAGLITPEYRAQEPLPLFPPFPAPPVEEQAHVDAALHEISTLVTKLKMPLLLEPITQFESRFWRELATVVAVCQQLANPQIGIALDTHNMNITEADIAASIRRAGSWVRHVHLADNNRRLPGQGHIDFATLLASLRAIGFTGWYSFECAVSGNFAAELRTSLQALRALT